MADSVRNPFTLAGLVSPPDVMGGEHSLSLG